MHGTENSYSSWKKVAIAEHSSTSEKEESSLPIINILTIGLPLFSSIKLYSLKKFKWNLEV